MKYYISLLMTIAISLTAADVDDDCIEIGIRRRGEDEVVLQVPLIEKGAYATPSPLFRSMVLQVPLIEKGARVLHKPDVQERAGMYSLPYDYNYYQGYDHYAMYFSDDCRVIQIEDGSQWKVADFDVYKTINWNTGDLVAVYSNTSLFRKYDYYLVNRVTDQKVEVKLYQSPQLSNPNTKFIRAVDTYYDKIYLSDGSVWSVSWGDSGLINQWLVGDLVVVGFSDAWFSSSNPAILINVNMNEYVTAKLK